VLQRRAGKVARRSHNLQHGRVPRHSLGSAPWAILELLRFGSNREPEAKGIAVKGIRWPGETRGRVRYLRRYASPPYRPNSGQPKHISSDPKVCFCELDHISRRITFNTCNLVGSKDHVGVYIASGESQMEIPADSSHKEDSRPYHIRLPGFIVEDEVGLGDLIKRVTYAMGIQPCQGCERRASALNRWAVFSPRTRVRT
jgi:hypothetical protein